MPYRPSIPNSVHKRVILANIDDPKNLNEEYIQAITMIYDENGNVKEPFQTLEKARQNLDTTDSLTRKDMLEIVVSSMFDEEGKPKPKAKQLFEIEKNKID